MTSLAFLAVGVPTRPAWLRLRWLAPCAGSCCSARGAGCARGARSCSSVPRGRNWLFPSRRSQRRGRAGLRIPQPDQFAREFSERALGKRHAGEAPRHSTSNVQPLSHGHRCSLPPSQAIPSSRLPSRVPLRGASCLSPSLLLFQLVCKRRTTLVAPWRF